MGLEASRKRSEPRKRSRGTPTVPQLKKRAWDLLSLCIRQQAKNRSDCIDCYTCEKWAHWKQMQAGHAIPGRTGAVLLDEEIIRPQCVQCNIWGRGMHHIFTAKLIKENGMDWWERKLLQSRQVKKWNRSDLQAKIEEYKARLEKLDTH